MKAAAGLALLCVVLASAGLRAQTAAAPASAAAMQTDLAKLDQRVSAAQASADNAWMLMSAALVLMMTGPGLALFYGGLVRQKNTLAIMMQSFAMMGLISVLWALVGYSLAFGCGGAIRENLSSAFGRRWGLEPTSA